MAAACAATGALIITTQYILATALLCGALSAFPVAADETPSGYDKVWEVANLYTGDEDRFFQSFVLSGRLQLDLAWVDSGDDDHNEFNVRRFRFGFKTVLKQNFTLHLEGEFNPGG